MDYQPCVSPPAAMIRGNHSNCREFATHKWLEIFIDQLEMPTFTHGEALGTSQK